MPLVALDKSTQERIDITTIENPRQILTSGQQICPLCEQEMIIVAGLVRINHFRHKATCSSDYDRHPESYEHLRTKLVVAEKMSDWFSEFTAARPELEVIIPEAHRVADVLFSFPNGWRIACEVQLASITTEELQQRTDDYLRAGIDTYWFFGKSAATPANFAWARQTQGIVLKLGFDEIDDTRLIDSVEIEAA